VMEESRREGMPSADKYLAIHHLYSTPILFNQFPDNRPFIEKTRDTCSVVHMRWVTSCVRWRKIHAWQKKSSVHRVCNWCIIGKRRII